MIQLCLYKQLIEIKFNVKIPFISGGSSVNIALIKQGTLPKDINHLRIGETLFMGTDAYNNIPFESMENNIFKLHAEIIELYEKPLIPSGEMGSNLEGDVITFDDENIYNLAINADGIIQAIGKPLIYDDNFYIYEVNSSTHEQTGSTQIDYHDAFPEIYFFRNKGIVYNIKSNNNPLKQYYMITDNGGSSWETKEMNVSGITSNDVINDAFFLDENVGWLVGNENYDNAIVLITEDGGQSWEKVSIPEAYTFGSVQFFDQNEGYATVSSWSSLGEEKYKLYHTQDGGHTWEAVQDIYTDKGMNKVFFLGSEVGMVAGMGTNAYRYNVGK
jgi:hypothetical protein